MKKQKIYIIWHATRALRMNQIARCDWLPERAKWSYLARSGLPAVSREKKFPLSQIINPLLTELFQSRTSRWLEIRLVLFFCEFTDLDSKKREKKFGQYPAILTSRLVNNAYLNTFTVVTISVISSIFVDLPAISVTISGHFSATTEL